MTTIEQAQEVALDIRDVYADPLSLPIRGANTIDALQSALSDERMRCTQADHAVEQMAAELAALKGQEPVFYINQDSLSAFKDGAKGWGTVWTVNHGDYKVPLYPAAGAQPVQQELVAWDVEESVLAIHRILKSAASFSTREDALRSELKSVFQAGRAKPAPKQEPVAYLEIITGQVRLPKDEHLVRFPKMYQPLYLAAGAQEQRKPLTDAEINEATGSSDVYWSHSKLFIIAIFRAAEAAHGIK